MVYDIHFRPTEPKFFLKAPLAPIYTKFEDERAPNENNSNGIFDMFFQNFDSGAKFLIKLETLQCSGSTREINLIELKKSDKIFENV